MSSTPRAPIRTCHELGVCNGRPSVGCTCHRDAQHHTIDTQHLPPGGYYFAPGAIDNNAGPRRSKRRTGLLRFARDCIVLLAVAGLIGFAAGVLQAKGWPL